MQSQVQPHTSFTFIRQKDLTYYSIPYFISSWDSDDPDTKNKSFVSGRSEPSSRTFLNGEQPYPWDLLQPRDKVSRHRGAELRRRYELLGGTSLLSPE